MENMVRNKEAENSRIIYYVNYRLPTKLELITAIAYFESDNKFDVSKQTKPSKMKVKQDDELTWFKLSEFTQSQEAFEHMPNWKNETSDNVSANNYTTFRCMCSTQLVN